MTEVVELFGFRPEAWMADALCAQTDPDAFFPEKGGRTAAVKAVCRACPVTAQCLAYAMDNHVRHGIWGCTSEQERRRLRARQAAAAKRALNRKKSA